MTDTIKIGRYTITFDDEGATFASSNSQVRYRINATTATNARDFLKHHKRLIFAMINAHPEELAAYQVAEAGK